MMRILREVIRILLGATFVFSGFVKAVDPLGSAYKFSDYFTAMGIPWAGTLSIALSFVLSLTEFGIGAALFLNYRVKLFSWFSLLFMGFFLFTTLWVAIKNPVTDCGCFGDAIILSNWETFYKNIVITLMAVYLFVVRFKFVNKFNIHFQNGYFAFFILLIVFTQIHSYNHLPLIDFRPYKIGNNINEGMAMPPDAPTDVYKNEFVYRNKETGKSKKFDETNYPWNDTISWEYVSMTSKLVKKGYHPPIHDFSIENSYGEDVADFFLHEPGYTFILVAYNLNKSNKKHQSKINKLAEEAIHNGMHFICLTSSSSGEINTFIQQHQPPYEFFHCDEITLKTIIRSNPGLILTQEGTILNKWHWRDIPTYQNAFK
jgi:uncharacterized membrane protein YphA (DoxX/SURF4 family)